LEKSVAEMCVGKEPKILISFCISYTHPNCERRCSLMEIYCEECGGNEFIIKK